MNLITQFYIANVFRSVLLVILFLFISIRPRNNEVFHNSYFVCAFTCFSIFSSLLTLATTDTSVTDIPEYIRLIEKFQNIHLQSIHSIFEDPDTIVVNLLSLEQSSFSWFAVFAQINQNILRLNEQSILNASFIFTLVIIFTSLALSRALYVNQKLFLLSAMLLSSVFTYNYTSMLRQGLCTTLLVCGLLLIARSLKEFAVNNTILIDFQLCLGLLCLCAIPLQHGTGLVYILLAIISVGMLMLKICILPSRPSLSQITKLLVGNSHIRIAASFVICLVTTIMILAISFFLYPLMNGLGIVAGAMSAAGDLGSSYANYSWNTSAPFFPIGPSFLLASSILYCHQLSFLITNPETRSFISVLTSKNSSALVLGYLFGVISVLFMLTSFFLYPLSTLSLRLGSQGSLFELISLITICSISIRKDSIDTILGYQACRGASVIYITPSFCFAPLIYCLYSNFFVFHA